MTTVYQIEAMNELCSQLVAQPGIKAAYVDDWGRHGNFQVFVTPHHHDRHTTRRIQALVRKVLPEGTSMRNIFGPDPVKERRGDGRYKVVGYSRRYWVVDIDHHTYHPETNTFSQ